MKLLGWLAVWSILLVERSILIERQLFGRKPAEPKCRVRLYLCTVFCLRGCLPVYISLPVTSVFLPACVSACLFDQRPFVYLLVSIFACLRCLCWPVSTSVCLHICLSRLSVCRCSCLPVVSSSVCLSACLSIRLSVCLSICGNVCVGGGRGEGWLFPGIRRFWEKVQRIIPCSKKAAFTKTNCYSDLSIFKFTWRERKEHSWACSSASFCIPFFPLPSLSLIFPFSLFVLSSFRVL